MPKILWHRIVRVASASLGWWTRSCWSRSSFLFRTTNRSRFPDAPEDARDALDSQDSRQARRFRPCLAFERPVRSAVRRRCSWDARDSRDASEDAMDAPRRILRIPIGPNGFVNVFFLRQARGMPEIPEMLLEMPGMLPRGFPGRESGRRLPSMFRLRQARGMSKILGMLLKMPRML